MKGVVSIFFCIAFSISVNAGELINNAKVIEVANTNNNGADFTIKLSEAVGLCSTAAYITFPESKQQSAASHQQAFTIALSAFISGNSIRIHNFENDKCDEANFILIEKQL